jgi:hypothetical protein
MASSGNRGWTPKSSAVARRARPVTATVILVAMLGIAGRAGGGGLARHAAAQSLHAPDRSDDFLIVDCLLPGEVRRLGTRFTFVAARRAIRTSARDCEIRGGEYVAFDRSNYATALKVWLPLAEQGDAAAQTYVGEIFEKGLGVPPDYAAAAQWFRRAAESGYSRAAINLGSLYEQGLGVPKDRAQAATWYRRAAGLKELAFEPGEVSAEAERLRQEVAELRHALGAKQAELDRTQRELEDLRRSLEQRRTEAESERGALARMRQELEEWRNKGQSAAAGVRALEQSIADREALLASKDREVAALRASVARSEAESSGLRAQLDRLRQQTAAAGPDIQVIEPELVPVGGTRGVQARPSVGQMALVDAADRLALVGRVLTLDGLNSLTVNGREETLDSNNLFKAQIPLTQPEERVRIVAIDRAGRKSALEFLILDRSRHRGAADVGGAEKVGYRLPKIAFGTYHALVIGNNHYRLMRPLKTAVNDAREVARILKEQYGFTVTLLLNASRYDILSALNGLRERLTDKDNLLIYYAGHGELDQVNQRGNWLPVDAEPTSSANWISNISITDVLNAMAVRQLLVVSDSCYAGTLTRSALGRLEAGMSDEERARAYSAMAQRRSRMVMTSGGVEPVVDSAGGPHSVFAQAFIELLRDNVAVLPGQELFRLLQPQVAAKAHRLEVQQVPEYAPIKFAGHEAGDFFFVRATN